MSAAADICAIRIVRLNLEGFEPDVYDDANRQRLECVGQPTIGYGCRCRQWSEPFAQKVLSLQLSEEFEPELLLESWYTGCDDVRRSGLLEIAFNQGDSSLENRYPRLIAAVGIKDWITARLECSVGDPRLKPRYAVIGNVLYSGVSA